MIVDENKAVGIDYTLYLSDGTVADTSEGDEPLYFLCGHGNIVPGLEKALMGMKVDEKKTVEVEPEDAYGQFDEEALQEVPLTAFPEDTKLEEGLQLALMDEDDNYIPAVVHEILEKTVIMDLNHPLAGEKLKFDIKIVDIREATAEELEHGHIHGAGGHKH